MSKIEHIYACPNCGSIHLQVSVTARAALTQDEEDGNLQTWVFGDHEWDNDSPMECSDCQYSGSAKAFHCSAQAAAVRTAGAEHSVSEAASA